MTNDNEKSPVGNSTGNRYGTKSPQDMVLLTSSNRNLKHTNVDKSRQTSQESLRNSNNAVPIDEASLIEYQEKILENVKPVLRKQTVHNSKNVVMLFKSIEVQLVEEKWNKNTGKMEYRFLSPIYVPVHRLESYMNQDKSQLEIQILKSIYEVEPGNFVFIDEKDLKSQLLQNPKLTQILVGSKSIGHKKKNNKSYAPKVIKSRLGVKQDESDA